MQAKDFAKDDLCNMNHESYHLMVKQKASAKASAAIIGEVIKAAKQAQMRGTPQDTNQPEVQPGEDFNLTATATIYRLLKKGSVQPKPLKTTSGNFGAPHSQV